MKRFIFFVLLYCISIGVFSQKHHMFNPEKFQVELERYITIEAALTIQEAATFFPVYREMRKKQHAMFGQMRRLKFVDVADDKAAVEAIRQQDLLDIQVKQLQQEYHNKFMTVLPARKVFQIIKAEEKFHRQSFKRLAKKNEIKAQGEK